MVKLQPTDTSMFWGDVPLPDTLVLLPEVLSHVPPSTEQPKVVMHVDAAESERIEDDLVEETNEEELQAKEQWIVEILTELQEK